jgi:hypothetical protein
MKQAEMSSTYVYARVFDIIDLSNGRKTVSLAVLRCSNIWTHSHDAIVLLVHAIICAVRWTAEVPSSISPTAERPVYVVGRNVASVHGWTRLAFGLLVWCVLCAEEPIRPTIFAA